MTFNIVLYDVATLLGTAETVLKEHKLAKGDMFRNRAGTALAAVGPDDLATVDAVCAIGAVKMAQVVLGRVDDDVERAAVRALHAAIRTGTSVQEYNDTPHRHKGEVVRLFQRARRACRSAHELVYSHPQEVATNLLNVLGQTRFLPEGRSRDERGVDVPTVVVGDDGKLAWNPAIDAMGVEGALEGVAAFQGLAPWCLEDFRWVVRQVATPDDLTRRETALPALRRVAHHGMPTGRQE